MKNISVQELKQKLDAGQPFNLVDVREPDEHAAFNVGGLFYPWVKYKPCKRMTSIRLKMKK